MQKMSREYKKLLVQHQVLQARLGIRDFFLRTTVKEVYENIGQVLSLVRLQLSFVDPGLQQVDKEKVSSSGDLVGQSIRDLRSMCRSFYPDVELIENGGLIEAIKNTVKILELGKEEQVSIDGLPGDIAPEQKLIVFNMLLEILGLIKDNDEEFIACNLKYSDDQAIVIISYKGNLIDVDAIGNNQKTEPGLSIDERIKLFGGSIRFETSATQLNNIYLHFPYNAVI